MYVKKIMLVWAAIALSLPGFASADSIVTSVTARQVEPWKIVEITVGLSCSSNELIEVECAFAATNSATRVALPVTKVYQVGGDTGSGTSWTRRFIWDAASDLGEVKIEDVALTVDTRVVAVQLWENGPYWATCNVGASKPEECGYYFWWGDTMGYKRNANDTDWISVKTGASYLFDAGCPTSFLSNWQLQSAGYIDSTGSLAAECDAATAYLGAPWRIPTDAEFSALISNCTVTWTMRNGVYGLLVTGKGAYASKSIFLPAAGYGRNADLWVGESGYYWLSTPDPDHTNRAWYLDFGWWGGARMDVYYGRDLGMLVRPLLGSAR